MSYPLISVIVTAYNEEKTIKKCVLSVLNQTFKNFEIIVLNDASTDSTASVISSLCDNYNTIKHQTNLSNLGLGLTRNKGLNLAIGDYIMFVDGDDWLENNALAELAFIAKQDHDIILMNHNLCYKGGFSSPSNQAKLLINDAEEDIVTIKSRLLRVFHTAWNKLYKRDFVLKNNLYFPKGNYEDLVFSYSAIILAKEIGACSKALYNYRQHPDTVPGRPNRKSKLVNNDSIFKRYETLFTFLHRTDNTEPYREILYTKMLNQYSAILCERVSGTLKMQREFFKKMQEHALKFCGQNTVYFSFKDKINIFLIQRGGFLSLIIINSIFTRYKKYSSLIFKVQTTLALKSKYE